MHISRVIARVHDNVGDRGRQRAGTIKLPFTILNIKMRRASYKKQIFLYTLLKEPHYLTFYKTGTITCLLFVIPFVMN